MWSWLELYSLQNHESITDAIVQIVNQNLLLETHMHEYEFMTYSCYRSCVMLATLRARRRFIWNGVLKRMTIWTLSLLKFVCIILTSFFVIVYLHWCNKICKQHRIYANSRYLIQHKQIRYLFDAHDGLFDRLPMKYKIKALFVVSIYI